MRSSDFTAYVDFKMNNANFVSAGGAYGSVAELALAIHRFIDKNSQPIALDFPGLKCGVDTENGMATFGQVIRVFATNGNTLDLLVAHIRNLAALAGVESGNNHIFIETEHKGAWASAHRFRISPDSQPSNRERDQKRACLLKIPFLKIDSRSTGKTFSLFVERRMFKSKPADQEAGVAVNGYGLSHRNQPVYLPVL